MFERVLIFVWAPDIRMVVILSCPNYTKFSTRSISLLTVSGSRTGLLGPSATGATLQGRRRPKTKDFRHGPGLMLSTTSPLNQRAI